MNRDQNINLRLSVDEKVRIEERAESRKAKTSDFLRKLGLEGILPDEAPKPPETPSNLGNPPPDLGPETEKRKAQHPANQTTKPETYTREQRINWLVVRITELHRDKERRWPGAKARIQADYEWSQFLKTNQQPEPIEPRDEFKTS